MRKSWIWVVLFLSFVVAGVFAQESLSPRPPAAPPQTPRVVPRSAETLVPPPPPPAAPPTYAPRAVLPDAAPPQSPPPPAYVPPTPAIPSTPVPVYAPPAAPAYAPVPVASPAPVEYRREVFHLRGIPAIDAARTLEQLLRTEEKMSGGAAGRKVAIVPDAIGNMLLVSGPPKELEKVGELIAELDQPPVMVRIEVVIGEPGDKEEMTILARGELTTLGNQPARLQMGRREPRVSGRTVTAKGTMNSVTFEDVGTQLKLTPRVGPDEVVTLEVDVEDSRLGPEEEGVVIATDSEGKTLRMAGTQTLTCETTLSIRSGQTVTLAGMGRGGETEKKCVVLVTAEVVKVGEGK